MSRDRFYVGYILERIELIERFTREGRESFVSDPRTRDAVLHNLELIGATVKRLSDEIREKAPQVRWKDIAGFRDVVAHDYLDLDLGIVWAVIERDLPELKKALLALRNDGP